VTYSLAFRLLVNFLTHFNSKKQISSKLVMIKKVGYEQRISKTTAKITSFYNERQIKHLGSGKNRRFW